LLSAFRKLSKSFKKPNSLNRAAIFTVHLMKICNNKERKSERKRERKRERRREKRERVRMKERQRERRRERRRE
jgi:hypothetical protein